METVQREEESGRENRSLFNMSPFLLCRETGWHFRGGEHSLAAIVLPASNQLPTGLRLGC